MAVSKALGSTGEFPSPRKQRKRHLHQLRHNGIWKGGYIASPSSPDLICALTRPRLLQDPLCGGCLPILHVTLSITAPHQPSPQLEEQSPHEGAPACFSISPSTAMFVDSMTNIIRMSQNETSGISHSLYLFAWQFPFPAKFMIITEGKSAWHRKGSVSTQQQITD